MNDHSNKPLPYDSSITAMILDTIEMAMMEKKSKPAPFDEGSNSVQGQTKTSRKLRVEISTDIDKTKTMLTTPRGVSLDTSFADFVWLKIIELFAQEDESGSESEQVFDECFEDNDLGGDFAADEFDFEPEYDFLIEDDDQYEADEEEDLVKPSDIWTGFNVTISLKNEKGSYFISSYFKMGEETLDLAKLIIDGDDKDCKYSASGYHSSPFLLKISITSLDQPIITKRI
jgi:hypothetical protein